MKANNPAKADCFDELSKLKTTVMSLEAKKSFDYGRRKNVTKIPNGFEIMSLEPYAD